MKINELTLLEYGNKYWGLILPDGTVEERFDGYQPGGHSDLADQLGLDLRKIMAQGAIRFASYLGGVDGPGIRIEYEFNPEQVQKNIPVLIQHISDHPTSGGFEFHYSNKLPNASAKNVKQAIAYLKSIMQNKKPVTEILDKPERSGLIPYYIEGDHVYVKVMKPSDPAYGGTEWQLAKGGIEPGLDPEANALKEAHEEVGLKPSNITRMFKLLYKNHLHVYAAEVKDKDDFDEPHYETGAVNWIKLPEDLQQIRQWQQWIFNALYRRISTSSSNQA